MPAVRPAPETSKVRSTAADSASQDGRPGRRRSPSAGRGGRRGRRSAAARSPAARGARRCCRRRGSSHRCGRPDQSRLSQFATTASSSRRPGTVPDLDGVQPLVAELPAAADEGRSGCAATTRPPSRWISRTNRGARRPWPGSASRSRHRPAGRAARKCPLRVVISSPSMIEQVRRRRARPRSRRAGRVVLGGDDEVQPRRACAAATICGGVRAPSEWTVCRCRSPRYQAAAPAGAALRRRPRHERRPGRAEAQA